MMKNTIKIILIAGVSLLVLFAIYTAAKKNSNNATQPDAGQTVSQSEILRFRDSDTVRGNKDAAITIVDYSDYQCPY